MNADPTCKFFSIILYVSKGTQHHMGSKWAHNVAANRYFG